MNFSDKIVTAIPLDKIWTSDGEIVAKRASHLTTDNIQEILKKNPVEFVVANLGDKLKWVGINNCYDFWKSEMQKHIANNVNHIVLDSFPGRYVYMASEWIGEIESPIILLEKVH